ncbi:MAG: CinA family protein [Chloroflexi bacterium]|nr:CinA family protein [Chloroflexota bacterium]
MENDRAAIEQIATYLLSRNEQLVVVETSAGGNLSRLLTAVPGASRWFAGGIVAYGSVLRAGALGLDDAQFSSEGIVSARSGRLLARAGRERFGVQWSVSETGIAGPQAGRRTRKPEGLLYTCAIGPSQAVEHEWHIDPAERAQLQRLFALRALQDLVECIISGGDEG